MPDPGNGGRLGVVLICIALALPVTILVTWLLSRFDLLVP